MKRIGVFVCHCGTNIAATVDVVKVVEAAKLEPGVVHAAEYPYLCSEAGQNMIIKAVDEFGLTGVVVSACSPRMHETTFRKAAAKAGLNPFMVEISNIREQCSWIHKDSKDGTEKSIILTRAAIAKVHLNEPLHPGESKVTKRALVIGGGIAGIQTALDIAEAGFPVDIVESTPSIGGKMAQLDKTFPTLDCSACILTPKMVDAAAHENITLHTYSEIEKVEGFVGDFTITIRKKARYVDMKNCTGCGLCYEKCPVKKAPSEFEQGLIKRTAIYTPFAQAVPNVPVIDKTQCIKLKTGKCGLCEKVCTPKAIVFDQQDELITEKYGAVIIATGYDQISLEKFGEYSYNSPDVITGLEFERLTNAAGPTGGDLIRLSDKKKPRSVTFIQCIGSRDTSKRGKPYCSKICCMYTAKHAMLIRDKYPQIEVNVFYIDVRTPGKNFDEFYRRSAEEYGVNYIKGQVGKIIDQGEFLTLQSVDMLGGKRMDLQTDLVVLATAIEPVKSVRIIASMLTASIDTNNFMTEAHPKLKPVESPTAGVFLSGVCQGPKDIPETVAQAGATAAKVIGLLVKDKLMTNPCTAESNEKFCNGCSACTKVCPYGAIAYDDGIVHVNKALCQGCGACAVTCPSGAMDLQGFSNRQLMAEVDAICR
ncbi:MAG: CoB--CoM heterodisulfide reductase iron-sulfur subunit A family protein [Defluviitaleaceae bacterium]|nr:CoB--CoM heterodisulfide reductase iron-sulfur subunit A family protein [Defluviitaleaceae bacterium]